MNCALYRFLKRGFVNTLGFMRELQGICKAPFPPQELYPGTRDFGSVLSVFPPQEPGSKSVVLKVWGVPPSIQTLNAENMTGHMHSCSQLNSLAVRLAPQPLYTGRDKVTIVNHFNFVSVGTS